MGIWDDWFGFNPPPVKQYSWADILASMIFEQTYRQQTDPEGYRKQFGNLTPQEVVNLGLQVGSAEGQGKDEQGNSIGQWTPEQIKAVEDSRLRGVAGTDVPPPTAPPPDQGGGEPPPEGAPPPYSGPSARAELDALLPSGFEKTMLTSAAFDPFVEKAFQKERGGAQQFIANALKRGQLTESGSQLSMSQLGMQDPGVRGRLQSVAENLLGTEQAKLQSLANVGREAAGSQSGEFFDPNPYKANVDAELAAFTGGLEGAYGGAAPTGLYDTSSLLLGGGGVGDPRNVSLDPYAVSGGQLTTGLDEEGPVEEPKKKRTTAVF